jgi:hypothetical protein
MPVRQSKMPWMGCRGRRTSQVAAIEKTQTQMNYSARGRN